MSERKVISTLDQGVRKIILNRPEKRNAFDQFMYVEIKNILRKDAENDDVVVSIITGAGDFYSSGTEFTIQNNESDPLDTVKDFIQAFIDYPKLLIAVVNGPAIGIAATTAALCDIVYCSDKAYFLTPFINLGLCAEGTSSFTYPAILGRSKASEAILLGRKIPAKEAREFGLVSEVIPHRQLEGFIKNLNQYGQLPVNAVRLNKKLLMRNFRGALTESNNREIEGLRLCFQSEEFSKSMMTFLNKQSKSKL